MKSETITYFNWRDIQNEICKEMGIDEKYFRDYHRVVGGEYKDCWHIWLHYFENNINNDTVTYNDIGERIESKMEWIKQDKKEWAEPFVKAVYKVWDKYNIQYIKYAW